MFWGHWPWWRLGNLLARGVSRVGRSVDGERTRASARMAVDLDVHESGVVHDSRCAILGAVRAIDARNAFPVRRAGEADVAVAQAQGGHLRERGNRSRRAKAPSVSCRTRGVLCLTGGGASRVNEPRAREVTIFPGFKRRFSWSRTPKPAQKHTTERALSPRDLARFRVPLLRDA